jgi:hypothetical protein
MSFCHVASLSTTTFQSHTKNADLNFCRVKKEFAEGGAALGVIPDDACVGGAEFDGMASASVDGAVAAGGAMSDAAAAALAESYTPYFQRVSISGDDNTGVSLYFIQFFPLPFTNPPTPTSK